MTVPSSAYDDVAAAARLCSAVSADDEAGVVAALNEARRRAVTAAARPGRAGLTGGPRRAEIFGSSRKKMTTGSQGPRPRTFSGVGDRRAGCWMCTTAILARGPRRRPKACASVLD